LASRETLHLLLLCRTQNEAEGIVSLLRNAGSATRVHLVTSVEDFGEQLQEKAWDLLIAEPSCQGVEYQDLLRQIRRLNKDLPLILITHDEIEPMAMEAALRDGAVSMVPLDESNLLLLVIQRELEHLRNRRARRKLEVSLRESEKRCQGLLQSSKDAVAYVHDGMHIFANQAYLDLFGYQSPEELEGMPIMDMIDASAQKEFKAFLKSYGQQSGQASKLSTMGVDGEGQAFPMNMDFAPATYADERCTQVVIRIREDSSELEGQLEEVRSRDLLTGLYNKPFYLNRLEEVVDQAVMNSAKGAVVYINIDNFGRLKSDIGIAHTDTVLNHIAATLRDQLSERQVAARIGEDIFAGILMGRDAEQALEAAEKLRDTIEHLLIEVNNRTVTVTCSIGVALINENSSKPMDILQQAHQAADDVRKQEGHEHGNGVHLFQPPEQAEAEEQQDLEQSLVAAIKSNGFRLLFQPLINLRGEEVEHYEALLRLPVADGDDVSAGEFFENPAISDEIKRKIDRWVILHTTKLLSEHRNKGHNTRVFINLSAASLADESLANWIGVAINAAKLPKGCVIFQFNEEDAGKMLKQCHDFTVSLMERGVPTSVSRFGCALKPFQNLKHLETTYVKVDGSFTQELGQSPDAQKHLQELLSQLHEEEKRTIVPLVESANAVASLWQMGVHFIQGYYVQAPQAGMQYSFSEE
jgi:diguanylate cyclase (GGDEF)-like protein/PAS domain S-box-containing protein